MSQGPQPRGPAPMGPVFSLQDLIFPARGSPQARRKLISFSEGLGQGQSLHIQFDRRTGGNKVQWPRLRLFEGRERKGAKPVSSISSGPFCPHFCFFLAVHVILASLMFMPHEQTCWFIQQPVLGKLLEILSSLTNSFKWEIQFRVEHRSIELRISSWFWIEVKGCRIAIWIGMLNVLNLHLN